MSSASSHADDVNAILRIKFRYGELIDRIIREPATAAADARALGELLTDDVVFDYQALLGVHQGREAILKLFTEILPAGVDWMWHAFLNPIVEVNGDRAEMRVMLLAMSVHKGQEQSAPAYTYGRYINQFVRTPGGWRWSHLLFCNETRGVTP